MSCAKRDVDFDEVLSGRQHRPGGRLSARIRPAASTFALGGVRYGERREEGGSDVEQFLCRSWVFLPRLGKPALPCPVGERDEHG